MISHNQLNRFVRSLTLAGILFASPIGIQMSVAQQCEDLLQGGRFTLVIPFAPGGGFDAYAGIFATSFSQLTDASVRIRYLPGAGGKIGINAVAEARPEDLVLGIVNPIYLLNDSILGLDVIDTDSLEWLGALFVDSTVWVARNDEPADYTGLQPRIFAVASGSDFSRILLPGSALGWNIELLRGLSGTNDGLLALLRGDIDFYYSSAGTLANRIATLEGLKVFLALTDGANNFFPEAAYLTGQGGIVETLTAGLSEEQRSERHLTARIAVDLAKSYRAIYISSNADQRMVSCLYTAVQETLFSEELSNLAAQQNLPIEPLSGAELRSEIDATERLIEDNWEFLQELSAPFRQ